MAAIDPAVVPFIAVVGDLVASRGLSDRDEVQTRLKETLEALNQQFSRWLWAPLSLTRGDEFEGVLRCDAPVDGLWWAYIEAMRTVVDTRFGFGIGPLSVPAEWSSGGPRSVSEFDGPCFHLARQAVETARREDRLLTLNLASDDHRESIDAVARLLDRVAESWSNVQWETVVLLARLGEQTRVAEHRGVTKQSVSDAIRGSGGDEWIGALAALCRLFANAGIDTAFREPDARAALARFLDEKSGENA